MADAFHRAAGWFYDGMLNALAIMYIAGIELHGLSPAQFAGPSPRMAKVVACSLVMPNFSNSLS